MSIFSSLSLSYVLKSYPVNLQCDIELSVSDWRVNWLNCDPLVDNMDFTNPNLIYF